MRLICEEILAMPESLVSECVLRDRSLIIKQDPRWNYVSQLLFEGSTNFEFCNLCLRRKFCNTRFMIGAIKQSDLSSTC